MEKARENWIGEQCSEIEENLRRNNSKRAYQLVKDLTTVKQREVTTIQDHSGKCLTEERYWTDGQSTVLSSTITRPMKIHQYWTVPRQTQRTTTPTFAKKWKMKNVEEFSVRKKSEEWTPRQKKIQDRKSNRGRQKNKRGDSKVESNDSPKVWDRTETSDIPAQESWMGPHIWDCPERSVFEQHQTLLVLHIKQETSQHRCGTGVQ